MADGRRYELEELVNRPGTYFNPQTEVLVVVDDSQSIDSEIFNMEDFEGADWVLVGDDVPVDEATRDELLETFQARYGNESGRRAGVAAGDDEPGPGDVDGDPEALEELEER
jgi:hypothetical protein